MKFDVVGPESASTRDQVVVCRALLNRRWDRQALPARPLPMAFHR